MQTKEPDDEVAAVGRERSQTIVSTRSSLRYAISTMILAAFFALPVVARADTVTSAIESPVFALGTIDNRGGWSSFGAAGTGCAVYDHSVTALSSLGLSGNTAYTDLFGSRALRISNAVTSGCFSDHTFSSSVPNEAGETSAVSNGYSGGERQSWYEGAFTIASTVPGSQQTGLSMTMSPDRGDGARMSYLRFVDEASSIGVYFIDYDGVADTFDETKVADLDRTVPHRVKMRLEFVDGIGNDVVTITIDGADVTPAGATTWEDYSRDVGSEPPTVDSMLFRTGGTAAPGTSGLGYLIDNVSSTTPAVASSGPTGPTGPSGSDGTDGADGATGPAGPAGTNGRSDVTSGQPIIANASATIGPANLRRRGSKLRVPILCSTSGGSKCVGTIELRNAKGKVIGSAGFAVKAGSRVVHVPTIKRQRRNSRVRVYLRTFQPNGDVQRSVRIRRVR